MNSIFRATAIFSRLYDTARAHLLVTLSSLLLATFLAVLAELPRGESPIWIDKDKVILGGLFWFITTFVAALLRFAFSFNQRRETAFGLTGLGVSLVIVSMLPDFQGQHNQLNLILWFLPVLSIPGIALFGMNESSDEPRAFILKFLSASFLSGLLSGTAWVLGIIALVGIDRLLFNLVGLSSHISVIFLYAFLVALPLLILSHLRTTEPLDSVWVRLFDTLSRYVLLPAIVIYELILATYSVKIVLTGEMPNGTVASLVSFCVLLAIAVFTLLPASSSTMWSRVKRGLFLCLGPFLGFLWFAVFERLSAYGFTAERYLLLVSAFCLTATTLWTIVFNRSVLPFFSSTIALGALIALAGPIGFESVSKQSQWNRLVATLQSSNLVTDGKWTRQSSTLPFETRKEITSILSWFSDRNLHNEVSPLLDQESNAIWTKPVPCNSTARRCYNRADNNTESLLSHLGIKHVQPWQTNSSSTEKVSKNFPYNSVVSNGIGVFAGQISCFQSEAYELISESNGSSTVPSNASVRFSNNCRTLSVVADGQTQCEIADLLSGLQDAQNESIPDATLVHSAYQKRCSIRFLARVIGFEKDASGNIVPKSTNTDGTVWIEFYP